jgi:gluconate 2-dehydrogenase alpha chain
MADAVVVGSGPGGSTAAMVLAEAGWDVTVLEKGANRFGDLTAAAPSTQFANDELKSIRGFEGQITSLEPRTFRASEGEAPQTGVVNHLPSAVGGGTVHWDAKTPRFWDIDFKKASLLGPVDGADITDWPFTYAELAPLYEEIERLIGVAGDIEALNVGPVGRHAPRANPYPMPPGPAQYGSARYAQAAATLGLHPFPTPMAINSEPYDGRPACVNCGFCSGHGCPIQARVGALAPLRRALLTGRVDLRPDTFVAKVDLDGRRATGVTTIDLDGVVGHVPADFVVLAPSAIESSRLALLSGFPDPSGLIGRGLMFHWFTDAFGFFLTERMHAHRGRANSHGVEDFGDPDFPGARAFAAANGLPYLRGGILEMGGNQLPIDEARLYRSLLPALSPAKPFGSAFKQLMRASLFRDRLVGIQMIGEDLPQRSNRVDLDPTVRDVRGVPVARITYSPHLHETVAQLFYIPLLTALVEAAGATIAGAVPATSTATLPSLVGGSVPDGKHIMGGMRMGDDPRASVLDRDGLVRGLDNVGVADASVFPTSGAANPTLTLMAVALRNARRWVGHEPVPAVSPGTIPATGASTPLGLAAGVGLAGAAGLAATRAAGEARAPA